MSRSSEGEKEIVLGNAQLFGIFLAVAVLLGIAFTGGYMIGRGTGPSKKPAPMASNTSQAAPTEGGNGAIGETHSIPAEPADTSDHTSGNEVKPASSPATAEQGAHVSASVEDFHPEPGQRFLQVAAVSREEADEVADILHKKGFRAHAAPKPGNPKVYRVLIGPIRDAADLSATRDALRRTGFSEVIMQRY
jgi:cell division septation protein DedD